VRRVVPISAYADCVQVLGTLSIVSSLERIPSRSNGSCDALKQGQLSVVFFC
jgi:hypothetical protein